MALFIQPLNIRPRIYDPFFEDLYVVPQQQRFAPWDAVLPIIPTIPNPAMAEVGSDLIKNENGKFEIKCALPSAGFSPNELKLDLDGNKLILVGERRTPSSFQRFERIFLVPDGVDKSLIKCEFDPSLNQLCIEAPSNAPSAANGIDTKQASIEKEATITATKPIESKTPENMEKADDNNKVFEPMEISKNEVPAAASETTQEKPIKGKDYIERETDEGIEIDTIVSP